MAPDDVGRLERALEALTSKVGEMATTVSAALQWQRDRPCADHAQRLRGLEDARAAQDSTAQAAAAQLRLQLEEHRGEVRAELTATNTSVDQVRDRLRLLLWLSPVAAFVGAMVPDGGPKLWAALVHLIGG